jgi:hypothetical protein
MDLDARQARNFFLAGTVAFPTPFPSTGTISFPLGSVTYDTRGGEIEKRFVLIQEYRRRRTIVRLMLQTDVSAIFVPGVWRGGRFRGSSKPRVDNFDRGEWFLDTDVEIDVIRKRLDLGDRDLETRNSNLRGIVFIPEDRRILRILEVAHTAGEDVDFGQIPCTCEWGGEPCTCEWGICCTPEFRKTCTCERPEGRCTCE